MKTVNQLGNKVRKLIIDILSRPFNLLLFVILGSVLISSVLSCSRVGLMEGMELLGSSLDYKMGEGVKDSWDTKEQKVGSSIPFRSHDHDSYKSKHVDPSTSLHFFADTEFKPDCCGATYSSTGAVKAALGNETGGCACLSKEQVNYLNTRGGNRTSYSEF